MGAPSRQPFSVRLGYSEPWDEAPYEGVPRHLVRPIGDWIKQHFSHNDENAVELCLRLRLGQFPDEDPLQTLLRMDGMDLLDVVDSILGWEDTEGMGGDPDGTLERILESGGSAYRVNAEQTALELRITPETRQAVVQTVDEAAAASSVGSAADHLAIGWQAVYGLRPDPVRAYSEAIKAVESAAHATIQPNHRRATLGTMLGELRNSAGRFVFDIPSPVAGGSIEVVEAMMRALWDGQTSRHGKQTPTYPESPESARAAIHLAAALVQWFTSGAVRKST